MINGEQDKTKIVCKEVIFTYASFEESEGQDQERLRKLASVCIQLVVHR